MNVFELIRNRTRLFPFPLIWYAIYSVDMLFALNCLHTFGVCMISKTYKTNQICHYVHRILLSIELRNFNVLLISNCMDMF